MSEELSSVMSEVRNNYEKRCERGATGNDVVASPAYYTSGGIEAKDALKAVMDGCELSPMAFYWWGCVFKYLWRWPRENGVEDLRKCRQCIDFLIEEVSE